VRRRHLSHFDHTRSAARTLPAIADAVCFSAFIRMLGFPRILFAAFLENILRM